MRKGFHMVIKIQTTQKSRCVLLSVLIGTLGTLTLSSTLLAETTPAPSAQIDKSTQPGIAIRIPIAAELKRYMLAAERYLDEHNFDQADHYLARAQALKVELPSSYFYFKGKVLGQKKDFAAARMNFEEYILRAQPDSKYYTDSLEMITQIENIQPQQLDEKLIKQELAWETKGQPDNSADYLKRITELYLATSAKEALVQHINTLLAGAPFTGKRIVSENNKNTGLQLSISLSPDKKIVVQKTQHTDGAAQIMSFSTSVYGLSREFMTKCDANQLKCAIKHKDTLNTWFEIANDEAAANEIAEAASALVLLLQTEAVDASSQ